MAAWTMTGKCNFMAKALGLFMKCDKTLKSAPNPPKPSSAAASPLPHYKEHTTHPRWEHVKAGYDFKAKGGQKQPVKSKQLCHDTEHYRVKHKSRKLSRACSNNRESGG
ncbi:MAG: hypothetical protein ABSC18_16485 [Verrucomicrobiota bacterium]